jgi:hypothetical protein
MILTTCPRFGRFQSSLVTARHSATLWPVTDTPSTAPAPLKYVMLGNDTASTAEKLAAYTGQVPWSYLAPHALTGSLYFVDPALKLEDVGAAISANQADCVQGWLKNGDLIQIEALHAAQWENGSTEFEALVVSPFVLCRPV